MIMPCPLADPIPNITMPAMSPLAAASAHLALLVGLQLAYPSPSRVSLPRLRNAKSKNKSAPLAPTIAFLAPGDAKNCQLPSSSSQNSTSRYSPSRVLCCDNPATMPLALQKSPERSIYRRGGGTATDCKRNMLIALAPETLICQSHPLQGHLTHALSRTCRLEPSAGDNSSYG